MRVKRMMVIVRIYQQIEMRISRLVILKSLILLYQMPTYMPLVSEIDNRKDFIRDCYSHNKMFEVARFMQTDSPRSFDFEGVCA